MGGNNRLIVCSFPNSFHAQDVARNDAYKMWPNNVAQIKCVNLINCVLNNCWKTGKWFPFLFILYRCALLIRFIFKIFSYWCNFSCIKTLNITLVFEVFLPKNNNRLIKFGFLAQNRISMIPIIIVIILFSRDKWWNMMWSRQIYSLFIYIWWKYVLVHSNF